MSRAWLAEHDAENWDRQFHADVYAGRLDSIADQAAGGAIGSKAIPSNGTQGGIVALGVPRGHGALWVCIDQKNGHRLPAQLQQLNAYIVFFCRFRVYAKHDVGRKR
jgi:hypothetical protein